MSKNNFPKFLRIAAVQTDSEKAYSLSLENGSIVRVLDASMISNLADALGFSFEIHASPQRIFGYKQSNGQWTGMIGMLQRSEVDMAIGQLSITEERLEAIHYSFPYHYDVITFMTDKPQPLSVGLTLFEPYSFSIWTSLITSLILVSLLIYKDHKNRVSYTSTLYILFGTLLGQPLNFKIQTFSSRFPVLAWLFCAFIIANGYRAIISAVLAFPPMAGIKDFSDLSKAASQQSAQCYTINGSALPAYMVLTNDESLINIAECLKKTEKSHIGFKDFAMMSGKKAFLLTRMYLGPFEKNFLISEDYILPHWNAVGVPKNFCCLEKLNVNILRSLGAGLFEKHLQDVKFFRMLNLQLKTEDAETIQKISLKDIAAAFYLLLVNYILATVILFFEILLKKNTLFN